MRTNRDDILNQKYETKPVKTCSSWAIKKTAMPRTYSVRHNLLTQLVTLLQAHNKWSCDFLTLSKWNDQSNFDLSETWILQSGALNKGANKSLHSPICCNGMVAWRGEGRRKPLRLSRCSSSPFVMLIKDCFWRDTQNSQQIVWKVEFQRACREQL